MVYANPQGSIWGIAHLSHDDTKYRFPKRTQPKSTKSGGTFLRAVVGSGWGGFGQNPGTHLQNCEPDTKRRSGARTYPGGDLYEQGSAGDERAD